MIGKTSVIPSLRVPAQRANGLNGHTAADVELLKSIRSLAEDKLPEGQAAADTELLKSVQPTMVGWGPFAPG